MIRELFFKYAGKILLSNATAWPVAVAIVFVIGWFDLAQAWMTEAAFLIATALLIEREQDRIKDHRDAD